MIPQFSGPLTEAEALKMNRLKKDGRTFRCEYSDPIGPTRMRCPLRECGHTTLNIRKIKEAIIGHFREHHAHPVEYEIKYATRWAWGYINIPPHVPKMVQRHRDKQDREKDKPKTGVQSAAQTGIQKETARGETSGMDGRV